MEPSIVGSPQYTRLPNMGEGTSGTQSTSRAPKNLCRRCDTDFATLTGFDAHRKDFWIDSKQNLRGTCISPIDMGYMAHNGHWYTPEGWAQAQVVGERLKVARAARVSGAKDSSP